MYERKGQPLLPREAFLRRMARHVGYAGWLVLASLLIGMSGYRLTAGFSWVDAFLETCMLLGGMGPVNPLPNRTAKVFAGFFALYAGLVFLAVTGLLLAPAFHRMMHRFHIEERERRS